MVWRGHIDRSLILEVSTTVHNERLHLHRRISFFVSRTCLVFLNYTNHMSRVDTKTLHSCRDECIFQVFFVSIKSSNVNKDRQWNEEQRK